MRRNPIVLQRFLREARSAESLEHPNIVSIYDRGIDQGRHYLVLEYVGATTCTTTSRDLARWAPPRR